MIKGYPVTLTNDKNGTVIARFSDIPEAMTVGFDSENALEWAQDALVVALSGYLEDRRDIPPPRLPQKGRKLVPLPPQIAVKLAIYQSMRDQNITQAALGKQMGVDGRQVRRILNLDHNTSLSHLALALEHLGKKLIMDITDAT